MTRPFPPGSTWKQIEAPIFTMERHDGLRVVLIAHDVELHAPTGKRFLFERGPNEGQDTLRNRMTTRVDCDYPPPPWVFVPAQSGSPAQFRWEEYCLMETRPGRWQWRIEDPVGGMRVFRLSGFTSPARAWAWLAICGEKAGRTPARTISVHVKEDEFVWLETERLRQGLARSNFVRLALQAFREQLRMGTLRLSDSALYVDVETEEGVELGRVMKGDVR